MLSSPVILQDCKSNKGSWSSLSLLVSMFPHGISQQVFKSSWPSLVFYSSCCCYCSHNWYHITGEKLQQNKPSAGFEWRYPEVQYLMCYCYVSHHLLWHQRRDLWIYPGFRNTVMGSIILSARILLCNWLFSKHSHSKLLFKSLLLKIIIISSLCCNDFIKNWLFVCKMPFYLWCEFSAL